MILGDKGITEINYLTMFVFSLFFWPELLTTASQGRNKHKSGPTKTVRTQILR